MTFLNFLQYHNAVPIALGIVVLGAGGAYAASNPETLFSATNTVLSVDNTYLVNKDLSAFTPTVKITEVTEDDENYFVAFEFSTIDVVDYVWRDTIKTEQMTIAKGMLGPYKDLGVYVTQKMKDKIDNEIAYLKEAQDIAKKNVSQKSVATAYSGLVGALLNDFTEVLPGYIPSVTAPAYVEPTYVPSSAGEPSGNTSNAGQAASGGATVSVPTQNGQAPAIQILGSNPSRVALKSTYLDLGVLVTDDRQEDLGVTTYVNGGLVSQVQIDTYSEGEWTIRYEAVDEDGNKSSTERVVIVFNPFALEQEQEGNPTEVAEENVEESTEEAQAQ